VSRILESQTYRTIVEDVTDYVKQAQTKAEDPSLRTPQLQRAFQMAAELLQQNETVVFPTETVYGLGANALSDEAVIKIFQAKGRPSDNPLIVHIADEHQLEDLVKDIPEVARQCMQAFWPGPLTLVMKKQNNISQYVTAGLDTVGIRMPHHPVALRMIREAGVAVAAPSANRSGRPSPTTAQHVFEDLNGKVPLILDGGSTEVGLESTVLDVTVTPPLILRPGDITVEMLQQVIGEVRIDPGLVESTTKPKSPGMKYTHYAPKGNMTVLQGDPIKIRKEIMAYSKEQLQKVPASRIGVLLSTKQPNDEAFCKSLYEIGVQTILAVEDSAEASERQYGDEQQLRKFGATLYADLRTFDEHNIDTIYAEAVPAHGVGVAIMNRMRKAAGNHVIQV
jgi:L-threonylcarbamoyladenylate synthase